MLKNQRRFFIEPKNFQGNRAIITDKNLIHQITRVLRLKIGEQIILLDNSGFEYLVILEKIDQQSKGHILEKRKNENEPEKKIILCQSLLKSDKFEQVLKFGTNIGITEFIPFVSQNSIIKEINPHKLERYQKIIQESAEQSCRGILPKLERATDFKELINFLKEKRDLKLIAWEEEKKTELSNLQDKIKKAKEIYLFIGPGGGFSEAEVALAEKNGFLSFSLGRLILRAEIAGVVTAALLLNC